MTGIQIGDYVYVEYKHINGAVIGDRGGHIGRWIVKMDDGDTCYCSSRDLSIIKKVVAPVGHLSTDQKLDLLLDYLGLDILDEPKIVKRDV